MNLFGRNKNKKQRTRIETSVRIRRAKKNHRKNGKSESRAIKNKKPLLARARSADAKQFLGPFTAKGFAFLVCGTLLLGGCLWIFILSPVFLVKAVDVQGETSLTPGQIQQVFAEIKKERKLLLIPENHILLLSKKTILTQMQKQFPYIAEIHNYKRHWPNQVSFELKEKKPSFVWEAQGGSQYILDPQGLVLGKAADSNIMAQLVKLDGTFSAEPQIGKELVKSSMLNYILALQKSWPKDLNFKARAYQILTLQGEGQLLINTSENWRIKTQSDVLPEHVFAALQLLINHEISDSERANLAYIDLRLPHRAFYCLKGNECAR